MLPLLFSLGLVVYEPSLLSVGHLKLTLLIYSSFVLYVVASSVGKGRPCDVKKSLLDHIYIS